MNITIRCRDLKPVDNNLVSENYLLKSIYGFLLYSNNLMFLWISSDINND